MKEPPTEQARVQLDQLIAGTTDARLKKTLLDARKALQWNGASGALDKLGHAPTSLQSAQAAGAPVGALIAHPAGDGVAGVRARRIRKRHNRVEIPTPLGAREAFRAEPHWEKVRRVLAKQLLPREDVSPGTLDRMPLNEVNFLYYTCDEFCRAIKAARERKGVTLAQIALSTKIPAFMFEGLERNDLRRWPKGLFRRSFFRDYARVIGLPDDAFAAFVRLFPDVQTAVLAEIPPASHPVPAPSSSLPAPYAQPTGEVRMMLDEAWHGARARAPLGSRLLIATLDGAAVLLASTTAWAAGLGFAASLATVAVSYFSVAMVIVGESPATWLLSNRQMIFDAWAPVRTTVAAIWSGGADAISQGFTPADDSPPEPSARLRVRIKVSQ